MRKILILIILSFFITNVFAITDLRTFPRDQPINLEFPCRTADGGSCDSSFSCFLTMQYPNTSIAYNNYNLSQVTSSSGYYNVTLTNMPIGDYNNVEVLCTNYILNGTQNYQFTIRGAGSTTTTTEGIVYLIVILVCFVLLVLSLWGIFKIQGNNTTTEDGNIINVNNLKYAKILLIGIAYTLTVVLVFFGENISYNVLSFDLATNIFRWLFNVLMALFIPFLVLLFVYFVIKFLRDIKINKVLSMGGEYHAK